MRLIKLIIITICGASVSLYSLANAQDKENRENPSSIEINSSARYMPAREVNAAPGEIAITTADSEYIYKFKIAKKLPVEFFLGSQYVGINNATKFDLPAKLTGLSTGVETTLPFLKFKNTYFRLRLSPAFYTDDWNIRTSAFRIPIRSFLIYQPTQEWTFIAGIAIYPEFKNNALPIIGFIYKPNDKLTYHIVPKNTGINYKLTQRTDLFTEAGFSAREFVVSKGCIKNIILEYNETRLAAGIKYKFNGFIQSALAVGGVFNRSLKYRDNSGKTVIKDGVYTELKINITI